MTYFEHGAGFVVESVINGKRYLIYEGTDYEQAERAAFEENCKGRITTCIYYENGIKDLLVDFCNIDEDLA